MKPPSMYVCEKIGGVNEGGVAGQEAFYRIFVGSETGQAHAHLPEFSHAHGVVVQIGVVRRGGREGRAS